jgi:hypothetical protein
MRKITSKEFYALITENPAVFKDWEIPLEITDYISCGRSPITHLSKHLLFSGKNKRGTAADFTNCQALQIATGTFKTFVEFSESGIEKIEDLNITGSDEDDWSANFHNCKFLRTATGNYFGFVNFSNSGIYSIHNLNIENPDYEGEFVMFSDCKNLKTLDGWDLSKPIRIEPEKLAAEKERRALLQFHKETKPQELPFL